MKNIERVTDEISKVKTRIASLQERLKNLERQKTELENTEIVALVRGVTDSPQVLGTLLKNMHVPQTTASEVKKDGA